MRHHDGRSVPGCQKNGQIAGPDVVRDGWNAGSTAQRACGLPETPMSAIVYAVPEFIREMSV
jgi:hypothetical protein